MFAKIRKRIRKMRGKTEPTPPIHAYGSLTLRWVRPWSERALREGEGTSGRPDGVSVSQIYLSGHEEEGLPPFLELASSTVGENMPGARHTVFLNEPLRRWIRQEYGPSMLLAFDKLRPFAYRADLARYLLLYRLGGWYFDISVRLLASIDVPDDVDMIVFAENPAHSGVSYGCHNGILYSKAGCVVLKDVIDHVYHNIRTENYGKNALYPTGPVCLGRAVAKHEEYINLLHGVFTDLTPSFSCQTKGFVFQDGSLFALYKPNNGAGSLSQLGVRGGNNYAEMYARGEVYDQAIDLPEQWEHCPG